MTSNMFCAFGGIIAILAAVVIVGAAAVRDWRQFMAVFTGREQMSASEFYERYYGGSGIAPEIVEGTLGAIAASIGCRASVLRVRGQDI